MTYISKEEENYVRLDLLIKGISQRAARALFDREYHPSNLYASLKKEYKQLKKLKDTNVIKPQQWNLLFTSYPGKYLVTETVLNQQQ